MSKALITAAEVKRIADLSRLGLTDEEIKNATQDLNNILAHFAAIQSIDTTGVPTADDATGLTGVVRDDTVHDQVLASHENLIAAAPDQANGLIKVPAVFAE